MYPRSQVSHVEGILHSGLLIRTEHTRWRNVVNIFFITTPLIVGSTTEVTTLAWKVIELAVFEITLTRFDVVTDPAQSVRYDEITALLVFDRKPELGQVLYYSYHFGVRMLESTPQKSQR